MDDDLFVPLLPKLAATRVNVSRQYILQLSIAALKLTTSQSIDYEEDEDSFFATVQIYVPAHVNIPQLKTTIFAGDYCQTMDAALESASLAALLYMQKANILIVNDLNFPELQRCQKEVVRARSWSNIFEHEIVKLNTKIDSLERELSFLKESNALHMPIQQTTTTGEPDQQVSTPPYEQESTKLVSIAKKVSTPPYEHECTELVSIAKKSKQNNQGENLFLSARTSADKSPSRDPNKTHGLGTRRALFTSKKDGMDA